MRVMAPIVKMILKKENITVPMRCLLALFLIISFIDFTSGIGMYDISTVAVLSLLTCGACYLVTNLIKLRLCNIIRIIFPLYLLSLFGHQSVFGRIWEAGFYWKRSSFNEYIAQCVPAEGTYFGNRNISFCEQEIDDQVLKPLPCDIVFLSGDELSIPPDEKLDEFYPDLEHLNADIEYMSKFWPKSRLNNALFLYEMKDIKVYMHHIHGRYYEVCYHLPDYTI